MKKSSQKTGIIDELKQMGDKMLNVEEKMENKVESIVAHGKRKNKKKSAPDLKQAYYKSHKLTEDEYVIPKGTEVKLPRGPSVVTNTKAKIKKIE